MSKIVQTLEEVDWNDQKSVLVFSHAPSEYIGLLRQYSNESFNLSGAEHRYLSSILVVAEALAEYTRLDIEGVHCSVEVNTLKRYLIENGIKASDGLMSKRISKYTSCGLSTLVSGRVGSTKQVKKLTVFQTPYEIRTLAMNNDADRNIEILPANAQGQLPPLYPNYGDSLLADYEGKLNIFSDLDKPESNNALYLGHLNRPEYAFFSRKWIILGGFLKPPAGHNNATELNGAIKSLRSSYPINIRSITELATTNDARTISIVLTLCALAMHQAKRVAGDVRSVRNVFLFDLDHFCLLSEINQKNTNRATFWKSLMRLNNTMLRIGFDGSQDAERLKSFLSIRGNANHIQFISDLKAIDGKDSNTVRRISFTLDPETFESLVDGMSHELSELMIGHKELLTYNQGLLHLFYQWLNITVKRDGKQEVVISTHDLRKEIAPKYPLAEYFIELSRLVKTLAADRHSDSDTTTLRNKNGDVIGYTISAIGYVMHWVMSDGVPTNLTAHGNVNDHLTGKKSIHETLKRLDS